MGGKKALRAIIYKLFPKSYVRYIEVFGGGGWVLFGKPPECKSGMEVYNDFNGNLANLFYCVKNRTLAFLKELAFLPLNSRDEFSVLRRFFEKDEFDTEYLKEELELAQHNLSPPEFAEIEAILTQRAEPSDVWRAAAFFKLIRYSYGSGCTSYRKANHKSKMRKQSKEDQLVLQDTHEPIVTEEMWEAVQKRFRVHADMTFVHENIFMGLVKCADCGKALNYGKTPRHPTMGKRGKMRKTTKHLTCATYTTHGKARCTSHYTSYDMLSEVIKLGIPENFV